MKKLTSRKLAGAIAAILGVVGVVLGAAVIGNVDKDVLMLAVVGIISLGGYQVMRQANNDDGVV